MFNILYTDTCTLSVPIFRYVEQYIKLTKRFSKFVLYIKNS